MLVNLPTIPFADILIELGGVITALGAIWQYVVKPTHRAIKRFNARMDTIEKKLEVLDGIKKQIMPNSGSSLSDAVGRIEIAQKESTTRQTNMSHLLSILDQRQLSLLDLTNVGFFQTDSEGNFTHVNRKWCDIFGLRIDEAMGRGWLATISTKDKERVTENWDACIMETRLFVETFSAIGSQGEHLEHEIYVRAIPMRGNKDEFLGFVGIVRNTDL